MGFGIGTETGGSIVYPASAVGASGLRPTFGRVSRFGCMALSWSLDKIGPVGRSAEDCGYVLEQIAGYDPKDSSSVNIPIPNYIDEIEKDISQFRLILCPDLIQTEIDSEIF